MLKTYAVHFCGVGGACSGIHDAGLSCVLAVDIWNKALDVRESNLGHKGLCMDVFDVPADAQYAADLLWTSPVCQSFSTANRDSAVEKAKKNEVESRDFLYMASVRYVKEFRPAYFVLENVTGLMTHMAGATLNSIRSAFMKLGYLVEYNILDSYDFGLPQHRERLFIVGSRDGKRNLLPRTPNAKNKPNIGSIMEHGVVDHAWAACTYNTALKKVERTGVGISVISPNFEHPDNVFPTITCGWGGGPTRKKVCLLDEANGVPFLRNPTVREGSLAQGFPASWQWPENDTDAWDMIGNAVSPPVARSIVEHLQRLEAGEKPPAMSASPKERLRGHVPKYVKGTAGDIPPEIKFE